MLSKAKKIFSNPLYLLAMAVSLTVLIVGSVLAFNALAANDGGTLDSNGYYKLYNIDYMYYNETETDVEVQRYYQEVIPINETWKIYSNENSYPYFKKSSDDAAEAFQVDSNTMLDLKLTAEAPDSSSPSWGDTVWVYERLWSSDKDPMGYHYVCKGTTTVGALLEGVSGNCVLYRNGGYLTHSVDFSALVLDTSQADSIPTVPTHSVDYCYAIRDEKPYTYDGNIVNGDRYATPDTIGLSIGSGLKLIDFFYEADPDIEYNASYKIVEDVPYGERVTLKKSTTDSFAFAQDVEIPLCTGPGDDVLGAKAVIYNMNGEAIHTAEIYTVTDPDGEFFVGDDGNSKIDGSEIDNYVFFNLYGSNYISKGNWLYQYVTGASGTYAINIPITVNVQYDYSRYKSPDGSNMKDPGNLEGTEKTVYKSSLDSITYQRDYLDGVTFELADADNSPEFHPQDADTDVWCATEFWRDKVNLASMYEKGGNISVSSMSFPSGVYGDDLKAMYSFNSDTGYWERTVLIEPIFEDCYLNLTYHDSYWDEFGIYNEEENRYLPGYVDTCVSTEVYPYIYKDDSGNLLDEPIASSVQIKSNKKVSNWSCVDYNSILMNYHFGDKFVNWNTQADGTGTTYDVGQVLTMTGNVDIYTQWEALVYHIQYKFNSPTGNDDDIYLPDQNAPSQEDPNAGKFPSDREIVFSKDATKDKPQGANIFANKFYDFYCSYYPGYYNYYGDDDYSISLQLKLRDGVTVPDGTEFQYWSLTDNADAPNDECYGIYLSDFEEGDDGEYYVTVYAIWEQPTYTLVYDENKQEASDTVSGMPEPISVAVKYADLQKGYALSDAKPTYSGKPLVFKGWGKTADSSNAITTINYSDFNDADGNSTLTDGSQIRVYAQWEENTYTLDYQAGEGHDSAVIPADESGLKYTDIKDGHALSSQVPTDTGYTFAGWQVNDVNGTLKEGGTVPFASFNNETQTAAATATWNINSRKVTYWEADGTTQIGAEQTYDYMSDVTVGSNAGTPKTFDDKTWTGEWVLFDSPGTAGDGQTIGGAGTTFKMPDSDVKFKAVYEDNTYTVRYTAGYDGSGQDDKTVEGIVHNAKHTIQENTFTRTGYDFNGWELVTPVDKDYPANPAKGDEITVTSDVTYKASWKIKQFTVTYKDGYSDGTANDKAFTYDYKESHTVRDYTLFSREGYTVTSWALVTPTTGYSVNPNDEYNVVEDVTYKAVWTANENWVRYEIDVPSDITYTKPGDEKKSFGTAVDVADAPTGFNTNKYEFSGWSSTDVTITDGSFIMPDKAVTIRGSFTEKGKVTLTYDANGATSGTAPASVTDYTQVTETIKDQGDLLRTGYKFDGWNSSPNGDGTVYAKNTEHTFTQNTTIYAKWTPNEYHVRYYDINGSELTSLAQTYTYGSDFTVRTNADIPSVTGKEIVGWKFKGGMDKDADGTTITGSGTYKMPAGDVEFIAEYNDIIYTVTYQVSNAPSTYTVPAAQSYKYGEAVTVADIPSIEGYNFTGWNCSQVDVSSGSFTMPAENVVLTGVFTEKGKVTLTYNANGATSGTAPASVTEYTEVTETIKGQGDLLRTGYTFNGWNDKQDGTGNAYTIGNSYTFTTDTVLYAQWTKNSFEVKYYEADGTTLITTHTYAYKDLVNVGNGVTPTIGEGREWNGRWELLNMAQKDADNADIGSRNNYPMPAETVAYKAVLDTKTYTVTYIMEGDQPGDLSYNLPAAAVYNHGDTVNVVSVPTGYDTSEYTFTGWNYNESGVYYAGGTDKTSFKITEDVVLKGVWEKITPSDPDKVTITYTSGITGDDVTHSSLNNTRTEQVTFGSDYTVQDNEGWTNYVRPGYKFVSWKVAAPQITGFSLLDNLFARFTGPATVGQTFVGGDTISSLNDSITLEAQWEEEKYTVTYDANGATSGTVPTDDKDYSYNEIAEVKDKGELSKEGAVFLNWNTQPDGNGTAYAPNAQITMTEDVTLYAIWKAEPSEDPYYTLKYDANGATSGSVPQDYTHYLGGENVTVADKGNLVRTDCTFKEWNTQADGKGTGYNASDVLTMPKSNVTLYAIWVNSDGDIVSPGTGENALGVQIALGALIISVLAGGCVVMAMLKKRRYEKVK